MASRRYAGASITTAPFDSNDSINSLFGTSARAIPMVLSFMLPTYSAKCRDEKFSIISLFNPYSSTFCAVLGPTLTILRFFPGLVFSKSLSTPSELVKMRISIFSFRIISANLKSGPGSDGSAARIVDTIIASCP